MQNGCQLKPPCPADAMRPVLNGSLGHVALLETCQKINSFMKLILK
jgi:hypothetical protein